MFACCGPALALRLAKRFDRSCASILSSPRVWVGHLSIPLCALHLDCTKEPNRSKSQRASPIIKRVRKVSPASNTPTHAVHSAKLQTPCGPRGLVLVVRARAVVRSPAQTLERRGRTRKWEGVRRFPGGERRDGVRRCMFSLSTDQRNYDTKICIQHPTSARGTVGGGRWLGG